MPKIKTYIERAQGTSSVHKLEVTIFYNQNRGFFAKFPKNVWEKCKGLSGKELKDLAIGLDAKGFHNHTSENSYYFVTAESERTCLDKAVRIIVDLLDRETKTTPVIIVMFNSNKLMHFSQHEYTDKFPAIGYQIGITYANEHDTEGNKLYTVEKPDRISPGGKMQAAFQPSSTAIIIPDTPENRESIEGIYSATRLLIDKLEEYTKTPEALLGLIENKIKLIQ